MTTPSYIEPAFPVPGEGATSPQLSTWLLNEDDALRHYLKGMIVTNDNTNTNRQVGVWFGQPDDEIRSQSYPYITIDMIGMAEDVSRQAGWYGELGRLGSGVDTNSPGGRTFWPTPMNITYQVASWARQPRHDRAILAEMTINRLHPRFSQISSIEGKTRRLEVLEFVKADSIEDGKRLFRNIWTVSVKSEFVYDPLAVSIRVATVNINKTSSSPPADYNPPPVFTTLRP